ncbi:hypothetical protein CQA89_28220 [Klebsiella pneumoniae]|nr:hypothetical protein CQA89_28220 [Klebsiella pneumoniae]
MMSLWDALRMNMMISYQELVRTFPSTIFIAQGNGPAMSEPLQNNYPPNLFISNAACISLARSIE